MRDAIEVIDLEVPTRIGITPEERANHQPLFLDITLAVDTRIAGESDDLKDTVDYQTLSDEVRSLGSVSEYYLVERFAEEVAQLCLRNDFVQSVALKIKKPQALPAARTIAVSIQRDRADYSF
jgi:dihydroneopterin aldolase